MTTVAYTALTLGRSATDAVLVAAELDVNTNHDVTTMYVWGPRNVSNRLG